MDPSLVAGVEFGAFVRARRQELGLDLAAVSLAIGGTPGPGFLERFEEGSVGPSSSLLLKLAAVLDLPSDQVLNAGGYATEAQRATALSRLAEGSRAG